MRGHPSRETIIEIALSEPQRWVVRGRLAGRPVAQLAAERHVSTSAVEKLLARAAVALRGALRSRLTQPALRFDPPPPPPAPLAKVVPIRSSPAELQRTWEAKLAAEGMPAELPEREMPHPTSKVEFLASTPRRRPPRKGAVHFYGHAHENDDVAPEEDNESRKREPGPSMGAWWTRTDDGEDEPDRWAMIGEEVRPLVLQALRDAGCAARGREKVRATRIGAIACAVAIGSALPDGPAYENRMERLAGRLARRMNSAAQAAERAKSREVLTGPQGLVLRLWLDGMRKVDIAAREGHSKVTIHWKIKRAIARVGAFVQARLVA